MQKKWLLLIFFAWAFHNCYAQNGITYYRITSAHTSFPDTGRIDGHLYHDVLYTASAHYEDSNVLILVPPHFQPSRKVSMIFWFHGWNNNIDTALVHYGIARQFAAMGLHTILVLSETAMNSPDSYGGKLEQKAIFKGLVTDVLKELAAKKVVKAHCKPGPVILAGHSGAYRVIAGILRNGEVPICEVVLFDALYANRDDFYTWLSFGKKHRFIDLYTDHGGTLEETRKFENQLAQSGLKVDSLEETDLNRTILRKRRILFIHSLHAHDDIIQHPDNFSLLLGQSPFLDRYRIRP